MKNIFIELIFAFIVLGFVSCDKDMKGTTFGDESGLAFATNVYSYEMVPEDNNIIKVAIYRDKVNGLKKTAELQFTDRSGLFSLKTPTITFADGSLVAYAEITYDDINTLSPTGKYDMVLNITNKDVLSPSNQSKITITVNRKLTFEEIGNGTIMSEFEGGSVEFIVKKAKEGDVYQLIDPYEQLISDYKKGIVIQFNVASDNTVTFASQAMGDYYNGSAIYINNAGGSKVAGKVVTLVCKFSIPDQGLAFNGEFMEVITLP